jgi:glutamate-1-semialdehyde 2,1-aminomutase
MTDLSAELFRRAQRVMPGGVSRNTLLRDPHPFYAKEASGCRIVDVEGVERLDFANNMASLIHGHGHPAIIEAVTAQLQRGTAYTMATEAEIAFAEHLCGRSQNFDKVRFMNSGTEAVMAGLKASRAFTGRPRIAKTEGTYHGGYDYAEVSQSPTPEKWGEPHRPASVALAIGTPDPVLRDVAVLPFNDPDVAVAVLNEHREEIACVLLDPIPHRVGLVPATIAFVQAMRDWTQANGALLMFDEVITFRTEVGGMQERYAAKPDLTAMAKIVGGGFPVGALAGRDEVMEVFSPGDGGPRLPHSGTFSANPITMTAGRVAMELYDAEAVARLNRLGRLARDSIEQAISVAGAPACVTGAGSLFRIHLKAEPPKDYRASFKTQQEQLVLNRFVDELSNAGVLVLYSAAGVLSTAMGEAEIDRMAEAVLTSLRKVKALL